MIVHKCLMNTALKHLTDTELFLIDIEDHRYNATFIKMWREEIQKRGDWIFYVPDQYFFAKPTLVVQSGFTTFSINPR